MSGKKGRINPLNSGGPFIAMLQGTRYFFNLWYNFSLFQVGNQNKLHLQTDKG